MTEAKSTSTRLVSMESGDRDRALVRFKEILAEEIELIERRLLLRRDRLSNTAQFRLFYRDKIHVGLSHALSGESKAFGAMFVDYGFFFMFLFCEEYDRSELPSQKVLRGRVRSGADDDMGLQGLFLELANAAFFRRLHHHAMVGNDAIDSAPDIEVKTTHFNLFLECKCVFAGSMSPVSDELCASVAEALRLKIRAALSSDEFAKSKHFVATFLGARDTKSQAAIDDLTHAFDLLMRSREAIETKFWKLEVAQDDAGEILNILDDATRYPELFARMGKPTHAAVASLEGGSTVEILGSRPWELPEAIGRVLSKALKQLGDRNLRQICVQIFGADGYLYSDPQNPKPLGDLLAFAMRKNDNIRRLIKPGHGSLGVRLLGDFSLTHHGEGSIALYCSEVSIGAVLQNHEFIYLNSFLRRTPATIRERPELHLTLPW